MRVRNMPRWLEDEVVFVSSYPFLLTAAALARMTGWRWRPWPPGRDGYRSIVGETSRMAGQVAQLSRGGL